MSTDKQNRARVTMTGPLERIRSYFAEFQGSVEACRSADDASGPERLKNAYGALHRLRDRYLREKAKQRLSPAQQAPLEKVFEKDKFIESMMLVRQVSEHVVAREPIQLWTPDNVPIGLVKASAGEMFAARTFIVPRTEGEPRRIDHLQWLEVAKRRINKALDKAMAVRTR